MAAQTLSDAIWFVYQITNAANGKLYIGITRIGVQNRWRCHVNKSSSNSSRSAIAAAIRKYGKFSFTISTILEGLTFSQASVCERYLIANNKTLVPNGYNIGPGGESYVGRSFTVSQRLKMSNSHKGKRQTEQSKQKMRDRFSGIPLKEDHKKKIALSNLGKKMSPEARENIRIATIEVWRKRKAGLLPPRKKQKPFSEIAKANMSRAQKEQQSKTGQLSAINRTKKGVSHTPEHCSAIKAALIARSTTIKLTSIPCTNQDFPLAP